VAVFGRAVQAKLEMQRLFLVGAGALGCEFLKVRHSLAAAHPLLLRAIDAVNAIGRSLWQLPAVSEYRPTL
jgi:hypothetical protein